MCLYTLVAKCLQNISIQFWLPNIGNLSLNLSYQFGFYGTSLQPGYMSITCGWPISHPHFGSELIYKKQGLERIIQLQGLHRDTQNFNTAGLTGKIGSGPDILQELLNMLLSNGHGAVSTLGKIWGVICTEIQGAQPSYVPTHFPESSILGLQQFNDIPTISFNKFTFCIKHRWLPFLAQQNFNK